MRQLIFLCIILSSLRVVAQESDGIVAQESKEDTKQFRLPVFSLGYGLMHFSGDVGYNNIGEPLTAKSGFQFEIQRQTEKRYSLSLFLLSGAVLGEEKTVSRTLNFRSSVFSEGISFRYDFISRKKSDQVLIPYLTAGVEYMFFTTRSDLVDKDGKYYHYWNDGTIRDIAQNDANAGQAVRIHRDYEYETDLRDADLDGFGKFKTSTWGLPVGAGVRFVISDRCSMHFSSVCHFTGSDLLDGVTSESLGNRQGNNQNDKIIYTSMSFRFAFTSKKDEYKNIDMNLLANEDADIDGVPDLADDSSGTPQNNDVDATGKPLDLDNDGIPDYRDEELNSAADAVVTENGATLTEEMIEEKFRQDSLEALPKVIEYLHSYDKLTQRNPEIEKIQKEKNANGKTSPKHPIPLIYQELDLDFNGIISPKEISLAIDNYLAKKSPYTVSEFFDLVDFFFSQK